MTCKKITLHRKCSFPHLMRPNPQVTADLVIFFEEIFNGKLWFLGIGLLKLSPKTFRKFDIFYWAFSGQKTLIECT